MIWFVKMWPALWLSAAIDVLFAVWGHAHQSHAKLWCGAALVEISVGHRNKLVWWLAFTRQVLCRLYTGIHQSKPPIEVQVVLGLGPVPSVPSVPRAVLMLMLDRAVLGRVPRMVLVTCLIKVRSVGFVLGGTKRPWCQGRCRMRASGRTAPSFARKNYSHPFFLKKKYVMPADNAIMPIDNG